MDYPLFSVIIPHKNRSEYIVHTLRTCMLQDYPNFQIIVSDDCSEDNSIEEIEKLIKLDSRIKLFAHKKHLGMRDNFEFALNQVKSGYVIALGGDDGLTPGCITRMYEIIKETRLELLTWVPAGFEYASTSTRANNMFTVPTRKFKGVRIIKSEDFLNKIATTFLYQTIDCPMFYMKGVASINLINKVKARTKDHSFYYCPTPDGFSGVVLAGEVEEYGFTYEPLSIGGTTKKSQGLNYMRTDDESRKEAEQFFYDNVRRTMHSELASQPYSPLITLMTADYLLTAKDLPGWPGKFKMFSYEELLKASFNLLARRPFDNSLLVRELKILKAIAIQHELLPLFNELMSKTERKIIKSENVYGFALTSCLRMDGSKIGITNIFEASIATNFIYNFWNIFSFSFIINAIKTMVKIVLRTQKYEIEKLPSIE